MGPGYGMSGSTFTPYSCTPLSVAPATLYTRWPNTTEIQGLSLLFGLARDVSTTGVKVRVRLNLRGSGYAPLRGAILHQASTARCVNCTSSRRT
ncbi:hypothetical protein Pcinc_007863 [Petrolisthes cinctipes]|uniref:Uncharacterized protein n=1 Tax=Petrolisthes cinctipes TaxID=88211 RepID=A0AAE1G7N4_PETCI|nr:hypothetical protein Pcinc_007863 [Petrolisthes cinctipes]